MNTTTLLQPVVLSGGSGTRLWPLSREKYPKQLLSLMGEDSLLQATLRRVEGIAGADLAEPVVVCNEEYRFVIAEQLRLMGQSGRIVLEPTGRNTAPALTLAALAASNSGADPVLLVMPADHVITDVAAFQAAVSKGAALAAAGAVVTFGITPDAPETGYGYIQRGQALADGSGAFALARFVEKPDLATAQGFLDDGNYSWNGGIFAFRAGAFMAELAAHRPDIAAAVREAVALGREDGNAFYPDAASFGRIKGESVDYAVMEKTARAAVVPVAMGWSDIGNWHALRDARPADGEGNRIHGPAELVDCRNVLVETDGPRVSVIGLEDIAIVINGDEVLVTTMAGAQKVGKLTGAVKQ